MAYVSSSYVVVVVAVVDDDDDDELRIPTRDDDDDNKVDVMSESADLPTLKLAVLAGGGIHSASGHNLLHFSGTRR